VKQPKDLVETDLDALMIVKEHYPHAKSIIECPRYNFVGDWKFYVDDLVVWVDPDGEVVEE